MKLRVDLPDSGYDITVERGAVRRAGEIFNLARRCLIVTDSGVPREYADTVAAQCKYSETVVIPAGEASKNISNWEMILSTMLRCNFTRTDCVVAVGGGVVGDLAGFAAASFMRGVDFYNIPTTVLAQVDSSIGGKVAVDLAGIKNAVGAFYQPKAVIVDADVLKTLSSRQVANGLAESVKMAITSDAELFEAFENGIHEKDIEYVIAESLKIKARVIEADEKESGLRRILNFGHTLAHGIEAVNNLEGIYHGEAVAMGILPMCSREIRERVRLLFAKIGLQTVIDGDIEKILAEASHDKKCDGDLISVVMADSIGSCRIEKMPLENWKDIIRCECGSAGA